MQNGEIIQCDDELLYRFDVYPLIWGDGCGIVYSSRVECAGDTWTCAIRSQKRWCGYHNTSCRFLSVAFINKLRHPPRDPVNIRFTVSNSTGDICSYEGQTVSYYGFEKPKVLHLTDKSWLLNSLLLIACKIWRNLPNDDLNSCSTSDDSSSVPANPRNWWRDVTIIDDLETDKAAIVPVSNEDDSGNSSGNETSNVLQLVRMFNQMAARQH